MTSANPAYLTPEQEQLRTLMSRDTDVAEFVDDFYPRWSVDPEQAAEALSELLEMGARL